VAMAIRIPFTVLQSLSYAFLCLPHDPQFQNLFDEVGRAAEKCLETASKYGEVRPAFAC
jgi:hypothetical protein